MAARTSPGVNHERLSLRWRERQADALQKGSNTLASCLDAYAHSTALASGAAHVQRDVVVIHHRAHREVSRFWEALHEPREHQVKTETGLGHCPVVHQSGRSAVSLSLYPRAHKTSGQ